MSIREYFEKVRKRSGGELLREAGRRLRAGTRAEKAFRGRALAPYAVSFWVTRRCNLDCYMCWVAASKDREGAAYLRADEEMTLDELKAVIDDISRWRPRIGVTGGEPFIRRDTLDFLAYIKNKRLRCGVNTNGTYLARDAAALVDIGLDGVMVSVDGPAEVHDRVRRQPGSFARARAGVAALLEERGRRGGHTPYVKLTCTITDQNLPSLAEAAAAFQDLPIDEFTFQHRWFTDAATAAAQRALFNTLFHRDTTYLQGFVADAVPPVDVVALREERRRVSARQWPFAVNFYPDLGGDALAAFYDDPRAMIRRPCFSRWLRLDVMPWGGVTPCLGLEVGDVRQEALTRIWRGAAYRRFRRELAARGVFPGCARCCGLFSD
jgi:MoaA/NifB/PqqE/SkfB family radical SAM enzyme